MKLTFSVSCWCLWMTKTLTTLSPLLHHFFFSHSSMTNSSAHMYFDTHTHTHSSVLLHSQTETLRLPLGCLSSAQSKWIIHHRFPLCLCWPWTVKFLANIWPWCNIGLPEWMPLGTQGRGFAWHKPALWKLLSRFLLDFKAFRDHLTLSAETDTNHGGMLFSSYTAFAQRFSQFQFPQLYNYMKQTLISCKTKTCPAGFFF